MPNNKTAESSWLQRPCEQCKGTGQYAVDDGSGEHPIDKQCSLCEGLGHSLPMTETDLEQIKNHISNIPAIGQAYIPQLIKAVETLQQELEASKAFYNVTLAELAHERHLHNTCKGQLEFITSKYDRCKRELEFGKSKYDRAIQTERERDEALQKERERCARICDSEFAANWHASAMAAANAAKRCAELIREQEKP